MKRNMQQALFAAETPRLHQPRYNSPFWVCSATKAFGRRALVLFYFAISRALGGPRRAPRSRLPLPPGVHRRIQPSVYHAILVVHNVSPP